MQAKWICILLTMPLLLFGGNAEEYLLLDELAIEAGTDKSSEHHNYTRVYAKHFSPIRHEPLKFLEIGIYKGNSVKLWENYFPNAELHFIDISAESIQHYSDRSQYHFLDQESIVQVTEFAESVGGDFDLIIDDGGHTMSQQINSFIALFPYLKSGGIYVLEDLHTSYMPAYNGTRWNEHLNHKNNLSAVEFLQNLVHHVNYVGAVNPCANLGALPEREQEKLGVYQRDIESIHFYTSLCIITKR